MVRQPGQSRHDGAYLERHQFRPDRAELQSGKPLIESLRPVRISRPAIAIISSWPSASVPASVPPVACHSSFLAIRSRKPAAPDGFAGPQPRYLSLVEVLYGYPPDGVVLTIGCDKTTPALLMAAATVNIPAIALSVGPMLNGWAQGERTGSGTIVWKSRERLSAGEIDYDQFMDIVASSAPSVGYCNTMGTATTMNSSPRRWACSFRARRQSRALSRARPGRLRLASASSTWCEDLKPSDIMTREAFENAIVVIRRLAAPPTRRSTSTPSPDISACR
jgi:dihydroxy-acid dehydratase